MKLYHMPGACSLAPHIVAREAGVALDLVPVDLRAQPRVAEGRPFTEINPKNAVPALLLDDGAVLTEVAAVMQYLAAQAPGAGLVPKPEGLPYWRFLEMLNFIATEVHKGFGPLFDPSLAGPARDAALDRLHGRFAVLEKALEGRTYLGGDSFSIVDAYAFTVLGWTRFLNINIDAHPNIQGFLGRVAQRPAVQAALKAEGLIPA